MIAPHPLAERLRKEAKTSPNWVADLFREAAQELDHQARVSQEWFERNQQAEFSLALLLAVSEHRAKSLEVMEDFIADLKKASKQ